MGHDKLIKRLKSVPADFTFSELETLLGWLNYKRHNKGSTSGSRVLFYRESDNSKILLHRPHPGDIMSRAAVRDVIKKLEESGDI